MRISRNVLSFIYSLYESNDTHSFVMIHLSVHSTNGYDLSPRSLRKYDGLTGPSYTLSKDKPGARFNLPPSTVLKVKSLLLTNANIKGFATAKLLTFWTTCF